MKVVAVTAFPPSKGAQSTFGYHAVSRFLESPDISELIILADKIDRGDPQYGKPTGISDPRVTIQRCWKFNTLFNFFVIVFNVLRHEPDVVWINLQYTTFGRHVVPAFLGLLIPAVLRLFGFPVIILLHNFLAAIDLPTMGFHLPRFMLTVLRWLDKLSMRSLGSANQLFLMDESYYAQFTALLPRASVQCVEQDLFELSSYEEVDTSHQHIITIGNFGTYKKLDVLLDAFLKLQQDMPDSRLSVAGQSHPLTPHYLETLQHAYEGRSAQLEFVGYVDEPDMDSFFKRSNIVVVTNSTVTGSSGVIRHTGRFGRGVVVPYVDIFKDLEAQGWGVVYFRPGDVEHLAQVLAELLNDPARQQALGRMNYEKSTSFNGQFLSAHLDAFRHAAAQRRAGATDVVFVQESAAKQN